VIGPNQKHLPENQEYSQERDNHDPDVIRTRNPSKLPTADPRLRRCCYWNRLHKNVNYNLSWAIRIQYIYFNTFYFSLLNVNVGSKAGIYHIRYLTPYLSKNMMYVLLVFSMLTTYLNHHIFYLITSVLKTMCIHCKIYVIMYILSDSYFVHLVTIGCWWGFLLQKGSWQKLCSTGCFQSERTSCTRGYMNA